MKLRKERGEINGVITATRGNHGQSIPFAAARVGISSTIVCPMGNSPEKNAAMRALGAELIETGHDFDAARETAMEIAKERGLDFIPSFGKELVMGVSTYAHELFRAAGELDAVYVPVGMGSGIVGTIAARDMLGLRTKVIGVVAEGANAVALSFAAGKPVSTNTATTFADGMAVRVVNPEAFGHIQQRYGPYRDGERRRDRRGRPALLPLLPHHRGGRRRRTACRADEGARDDGGTSASASSSPAATSTCRSLPKCWRAKRRRRENLYCRHPGEGRGPASGGTTRQESWIPAFAGMTARNHSETESPPSTASTWPLT